MHNSATDIPIFSALGVFTTREDNDDLSRKITKVVKNAIRIDKENSERAGSSNINRLTDHSISTKRGSIILVSL
jgi:hypothetical protein